MMRYVDWTVTADAVEVSAASVSTRTAAAQRDLISRRTMVVMSFLSRSGVTQPRSSAPRLREPRERNVKSVLRSARFRGMPRLHLELLGGFSARLDDGEPCALPTRKARALLAYLAVPPGRFHSRDKLAALLWGDTPEAQARQSFRQALGSLRRVLSRSQPPALLAQDNAIALDPRAVVVDVAGLELALADGTPQALERLPALYKGDLLDGFSVDVAPFEEWRVVERERLHELALDGLGKLLREQMRVAPPE